VSKKAKAVDEALLSECASWQKKLNLVDWEIEFRVARPKDMADRTSMGKVIYRLHHKRARILLIPQRLRSKKDQPVEHTIVHELLHLVFAAFTQQYESGSPAHVLEEQAINALSCALSGFTFRGL
jgi:predicted SprT family Zn-dependent metalloprotease